MWINNQAPLEDYMEKADFIMDQKVTIVFNGITTEYTLARFYTIAHIQVAIDNLFANFQGVSKLRTKAVDNNVINPTAPE